MISIVYVTCPSVEVAKDLSQKLLNQNIIACANILPGMLSMYRWQSQAHCESEVVVLLKTRSELVDTVLNRVDELHPYDTPCAMEIPIEQGLESYMRWLETETEPQMEKS